MENTWKGRGEDVEWTRRGRMRTKFAERESERLDVATEMKTQTGTTRGFSWHVRLPRNTEHVVFGSQLWLRASSLDSQ